MITIHQPNPEWPAEEPAICYDRRDERSMKEQTKESKFYVDMPELWYVGLTLHLVLVPFLYLLGGSKAFFGAEYIGETILAIVVALNLFYSFFVTRIFRFRNNRSSYLLVTGAVRLVPLPFALSFLIDFVSASEGASDSWDTGVFFLFSALASIGSIVLFSTESSPDR